MDQVDSFLTNTYYSTCKIDSDSTPAKSMCALTKGQFALVVGHSVQQGDGATRIAEGLVQEIDVGVSSNLVCLLLPE